MAAAPGALEAARDRQDRAALEKTGWRLCAAAAAKQPANAAAQYRAALALPRTWPRWRWNCATKGAAQQAAEHGIRQAERAIAGAQPDNAEYYRVLGTLCGQVIPANVLAGLSYGKRRRRPSTRRVELDPKSAQRLRGPRRGELLSAGRDGRRHRQGASRISARPSSWIRRAPRRTCGWGWRCGRRTTTPRRARRSRKSLQLNPKRVWVETATGEDAGPMKHGLTVAVVSCA